MALLDARKAARKILAGAQLGGDPQGAKALKRREAARTVRSVVDTYLEARKPELRPASYRIARLYLTGPYFRPLHPIAVSGVTRSDVASCIRSVVRNHSATTAGAARRALSAFFGWAIAEGLLGNGGNPVDGSHQPDHPAPRDRVLTNSELVAVWRACRDDDYGRIVRLLILLGSRRQEIGGMRWSELDLDAGTGRCRRRVPRTTTPMRSRCRQRRWTSSESVPRSTRDNLFGDRAGDGFTAWTLASRSSIAVLPAP